MTGNVWWEFGWRIALAAYVGWWLGSVLFGTKLLANPRLRKLGWLMLLPQPVGTIALHKWSKP